MQSGWCLPGAGARTGKGGGISEVAVSFPGDLGRLAPDLQTHW